MKNSFLLILSTLILTSCSKEDDNTITYTGSSPNKVEITLKSSLVSIIKNNEVFFNSSQPTPRNIDTTITQIGDKKGTRYDILIDNSYQFNGKLQLTLNNSTVIDSILPASTIRKTLYIVYFVDSVLFVVQ